MNDIVTQIRVLIEEFIVRHHDTPSDLVLGDEEYDALEKWCEENLTLVQDPTVRTNEFMGLKVHRSGRPRGIQVK